MFSSGLDTSDQKELAERHKESEGPEVGHFELAEIIDVQSIQSLMNDFYKLVHIPMGLDDLNGKSLVSVGWQDICTKFHRVHPETCKYCFESNKNLSSGIPPGEIKKYKCFNNMWDIATPIIVNDQHVGNIVAGQFFFKDEPLDYEFFRSQARKYGFNEKEYIEALDKVPRLSREQVDIGTSFFRAFANMISQLSYSNIMLSKSLSVRDELVSALRLSESKYRHIIETAREGIWILDTNNRTIFVNRKVSEMLGYSIDEILGQSPQKFLAPKYREIVVKRLNEHRQRANPAIDYQFIRKDGSDLWCILSTTPLFDDDEKYAGSLGMLTDITERKSAEEKLRESEEKYRYIVETANEGILITSNEKIATYINKRFAEMLGYAPEEIIGRSTWDLISDEYKPIVEMNLDRRRQGISNSYELKLMRKDGYPLWTIINAKPLFDNNGIFIGSMSMFTDITKLKETENNLKESHDFLNEKIKERTIELETAYYSLKESEERLAEAQKMAHIGNMDWSLVTGEVYWSNEMYNIFKRNPQEPGLTYEEFLKYMHPEDQNRIYIAIKKALSGESVAGDYSIILANGEERKIFSHLITIFNEKGTPIQIKGTFQDITELKKSEEKIRNLANIVESSYDAIITISLEGYILSWNKSAKQVYGYSQEESLGKPISFVAPPHLCDETKKLIEKVIRGESVYNYETVRVRKDGKLINISLTLSPVYDFHGKITAASAISRDITEKKVSEEKLRESEEKYRNIVETANEGIAIINEQFKTTYVNQKMADMVGYNVEACLSKSIFDFISEDDRDIIKTKFKNKSQVTNEHYEFKLLCKDGSHLWVILSAKSLFDEDGKFVDSLIMLTDITRKKETEIELMNTEIARKKEIHHRIKNNLQVISSLLDLQADKFRNRMIIKNSEMLEAFKESQDRVISMALIHEELHKGDGFEKLNFSPYVEELTANLLKTYSLGTKNISSKLSLDNNVFLNMDLAVPLGMIINELVSNSFKHAFKDRNEGEIQIKLHRAETQSYCKSVSENSNGTTYVLTISDNGVGIPAAFDVEAIDSLGLQLVSSLVTQLDGELEIKSSNGTEFIIRFTVEDKNNQM